MNLKENIKVDLTAALKNGNKEKAGVLRFVLSEIQRKEKDKQGQSKPPELTDEEIIQVIQKEFKKRREAIDLFKKGGRADLVKKEEVELVFIEGYIPRQMSSEEIRAVIDKIFSQGNTDFNSLMRETMKELKGRADGGRVAELIKARTSA